MTENDSREWMLEAAWEMVVESFGFDVSSEGRRSEAKILEQLRAAEIAKRSGLTTGAFYNRWPNRESFLDDFLEYALSVDRSPTLSRILGLAGSFTDESYLERVMILAREDLDAVTSNPAFAIQTHLWSLMRGRDDIGERMARMYRDFREPVLPMLESLLAGMSREVRPPFTIKQVSDILVALVEGFTMQKVAGGEDGPDGDLFGWTILALLPAMTRPVGDDQTLFDALTQLLSSGTPSSEAEEPS